jgi:hypothetical protein
MDSIGGSGRNTALPKRKQRESDAAARKKETRAKKKFLTRAANASSFPAPKANRKERFGENTAEAEHCYGGQARSTSGSSVLEN